MMRTAHVADLEARLARARRAQAEQQASSMQDMGGSTRQPAVASASGQGGHVDRPSPVWETPPMTPQAEASDRSPVPRRISGFLEKEDLCYRVFGDDCKLPCGRTACLLQHCT